MEVFLQLQTQMQSYVNCSTLTASLLIWDSVTWYIKQNKMICLEKFHFVTFGYFIIYRTKVIYLATNKQTNKQTSIESVYKLLTVAPSSLPGRRPDATIYVLPIVFIFSIPLNFGFNSNYMQWKSAKTHVNRTCNWKC